MSVRTVNKKTKIFIWIIVSISVIGIAAQLLFTQKVKSALAEQIPENIQLEYRDLSTNVFLGNIALKNVELNTSDGNTQVLADLMAIKGIGYLSLLSGKTAELGEVYLEKPQILLKQQMGDTLRKKALPPESASKLAIKKVKLDQGSLIIRNIETDSLVLEAKTIDLNLSQLELDPKPESQQPPFALDSYEIIAEDLYFDVSPFEYMRWEKFQLNKEEGNILNLIFRTKYSREELTKRTSVEHDHFDVTVDQITLSQPDILGATGPKLHAPSMEVHRPIITVYRNLLMPPNPKIKPLPNQILREMPLDLKIDSLTMSDGQVNFYKKTMADVAPQQMSLTSVYSKVKNIHSRGEGMVEIVAKNQIMGEGQFTLEYTFDPQSLDNSFMAKGSLLNFDTEKVVPFIRSTLNAEIDGTINQMYFTVSGNEYASQGEMKMKYDQFKFVALKKDHLTVNKFKSGVANLLTKKGDTKADEDGFRHGQFKVERDRTRSFVHNVFRNMRAGMFRTMVGSGKER
ncbi:DUF748 domain-containing protein [Flagellimonas sp. GZD32]|uniref:DUF748 domain-containing protein n=1 Tax=Flagellimonas cixiensis TaxID=3228750 RepID=UPI0035C9205B